MSVKNNQRRSRKRLPEEDVERMTVAAEMYYGPKNFAQKEIAKVLRCSTTEVGRLLKSAEAHGILQIQIRRHKQPLRDALIERYQLKEVRISPTYPGTEETREGIASEAAQFFDEAISHSHGGSTMSIGISGGRTIHKMVDLLTAKSRHIAIYPLTGIWRDLQINYVDSGVLVHSLWLKCKDGAHAYWFPIEPISHNAHRRTVRNQRKRYLKNPQISEIYSAANDVDLALIGVGPVREHSSTIRQLSGIGITYEKLRSRSAIGIAAGVWYNKRAKPVITDYFLSVPLDAFQKLSANATKRVVVVAGGSEKVEAIRVLLEHRICNSLITDSKTASLLLLSTESSQE